MVVMTVSAQPNRRQRSNSYQDPMVQRMEKTQRALQNLQEMLGPVDPELENQNSVTDIDGHEYQTVKIGNSVWMAENLKVSRYNNGDSITNVKDSAAWMNLSTGAWCEYNNNSENGERFGKLYNYFAVADKRRLAPKGYHVATDAEWTALRNFLAGEKADYNGKKYTRILDGSNKMQLKLMPGICVGEFVGGDKLAYYWTPNECGKGILYWPYIIQEDVYSSYIFTTDSEYTEDDRIVGCSVRCVKDVDAPKPVATTTSKPKVKSKKK